MNKNTKHYRKPTENKKKTIKHNRKSIQQKMKITDIQQTKTTY